MTKYCENRTVIITGAGGGLGRSHALALAAEGANLVINDINLETATETAEMIKANGGKAIPNNDSIVAYDEAGKIIQNALETFGGLDAIVNNAGICRDRMFTSITPEDWHSVINVHLNASFNMGSHGAKYWREQSKAGHQPSARIINTSSGAGLCGSIGQTNYVAAKAGILAMTINQAAELARYGITANAIAPQARTGMTEDVFADMMKRPEDGSFDKFNPANVTPLVVYLCSHHSRHITGHCFESFGGQLSIAQGWKQGSIEDKAARYAIDEIGNVIDKLLKHTPPAQKVYGT